MHVDDLGIFVYMTQEYLVSYLQQKHTKKASAAQAATCCRQLMMGLHWSILYNNACAGRQQNHTPDECTHGPHAKSQGLQLATVWWQILPKAQQGPSA
jgi:hypothetical protein